MRPVAVPKTAAWWPQGDRRSGVRHDREGGQCGADHSYAPGDSEGHADRPVQPVVSTGEKSGERQKENAVASAAAETVTSIGSATMMTDGQG
ncbi:hypothetical protein ACFQH2_04960 [Natronoarchaeum sp. GCM10025703]|uniref:hypothetical protein n=1 Tax=Natronoarchaeum sp. GCM10025703 TaxID=3252685 RepID=UPI00360D41C4